MPDFSDLPASSEAAASRPGPPIVEAVLLGHLPGYASPWLSQYADELAARHGGAALVRLSDHEAELEEFDPPEGPTCPPANFDLHDFAAALSTLRGRVGAWLVVMGEVGGGLDRDRLGDVDRWTLLSGVDDASVVGAYRLLKLLLSGGSLRPPSKGVGVVFMGCDEEQAADAADRLGRTAAAALGAQIELAGVRQRIVPVRRRRLGRFGFGSEHPWPPLRRFFDELAEGPPPRSAPVSRPPSEIPDPVAEPDGPRISEEELAALHEVEPPTAAPRPEEAAKPEVRSFIDAPPPAAAIEERGDERQREDAGPRPAAVGGLGGGPVDLSIYLPDAEAISARCPRHPAVQLAVDRGGCIHLMLMAAATVSVNDAIRELLEARAWAEEHRDLLVPLRRGTNGAERAAPAATEPLMHLFTDHPRAALDLAYAGPPGRRLIRLHLLKGAEAVDTTGHVHEELS